MQQGCRGALSQIRGGNCWGVLGSFDLCVPVVLPVVPAVTVLFSDVNVNGVSEVVFSDSDCDSVEPQTFLVQKTRSKCGFGKWDGIVDRGRKSKPSVDCARRWTNSWRKVKVEISELEHFLPGPEDADMKNHVFRRKREGGRRLLQVRAARRTSRRKEQVEALKWLMQRVLPRQQEKCRDVQPEGGLHGPYSGPRGPDPSQETPREESAMKFDHAQLFREFDAFMPGEVYIKSARYRGYYRRLSPECV